MADSGSVRAFYDEFSALLLRDYLLPNRRVLVQLDFLRGALPPDVGRVLVIGSGNGQACRFIARRLARRANVVGVDISPRNVAVARVLHAHSRVEYRCLDIIADPPPGRWDAIVLPDVYEHIRRDDRPRLHAQLAEALTPRGRLLLTLPTPQHQAMLQERGTGLQIIDETVTLADMQRLAADVHGVLTHFAMICVWGTTDYQQVVIERGREVEGPLMGCDRLPIYRCPRHWGQRVRVLLGSGGLAFWPWRRLRVWWNRGRLGATGSATADGFSCGGDRT